MKDSFSGTCFEFVGKEATEFLQRLASADMNSLSEGVKSPSAFLDGRGRIISLFWADIKGDMVRLHVPSCFETQTLEYIEKMHFGEEFEVRTSATELKELPGFPHLDLIPGMDLGFLEGIMVLDGPFDHFVSRGKGCYPGQEVVEKIYSYGRRPKALVRVEVQGPISQVPQVLEIDGKKVGQLVTQLISEDKTLGLAFVQRAKAEKGQVFKLKDLDIQAFTLDELE